MSILFFIGLPHLRIQQLTIVYYKNFNKITIHLFSESYVKELASFNNLMITDYKKPDFITGTVKMINKLKYL